MEKKAVSGIMLTLLLTSMLMLAFSVQPAKAEPATIIVPDDYPTIQAAVNAASPGDTIIVRDGTYTENVDVTKSLTIKSENGAEVTIVQAANEDDHVFEVTADYVNINGFTVQGAGDVYLYDGGEDGWEIEYDFAGIFIEASHCNISNNTVRLNVRGIDGSSNNILINNTVYGNFWVGIHVSSNNILTNNTVYGNWDVGISGSSNNILTNNTVYGNGDPYGVYWLGRGISLWRENTLTDNTIYGNDWAGISLFGDSNTLTDNTIYSNGYAGIWLYYSNHNTLSNNTINDNQLGIEIDGGSHNSIYLNNFISNSRNVWLEYYPTNIWNSPEEITYTYNGETYTNYLGNYWSDYTGSDIDGDGIGDTPYSIDSDKDNYPLMQPFENYIFYPEYPRSEQTELKAPWEGIAQISQGNHGPSHKDYETWDNTYAIDVALAVGSDVLAPADGVVKHVDNDPSGAGGKELAIEHTGPTGKKFVTVYLHLSDILVGEGDFVKQGQVVAKSGATGDVTGPHLHFHMWRSKGSEPEWAYDSHTMPIERLVMKQVGVDSDFREYDARKGELDDDKIAGKLFESNNIPLLITQVWTSESIRGPEISKFPAGTKKVYVNYAYVNPIGSEQKITCYDDEGRVLLSWVHISEHVSGIGTWGLTYPGEEFWPRGSYRAELFINDVLLATVPWTVEAGYAIIVVGWGGLREKWIFNEYGNLAYKVLRNLGYSDDHIYYLNSDIIQDVDGDGESEVDAVTSINNLEFAIKLAKYKLSKDTSALLVIYMVGHIDEAGAFEIIRDEEYLAPYDFNNMLDEFPKETKMFIFIDSCYAGRFITGRYTSGSISASNRVIVASTHDDQKKYPYFSHSSLDFWLYLHQGLNIKEAFIITGDNKHFWLDDNGDKVGHPPSALKDDGYFAEKIYLGIPGSDNLPLNTYLILAKLLSPGYLQVYDPQGRVTGLVNGELREEIPTSIYNEEDKIVVIFNAMDIYHYRVIGTDTEIYGLEVTFVTEVETVTFTSTAIPILVNAIHQYTVDWDALSRGEEGVILQIDSDSDGVFEQSITADGELTHDEFMLQTATTIDFDPDTLNLKSKDKWVTVYIELPAGYDVSQIDVSSIVLNGTVPALAKPISIGDYDGDGIPDLMVKFDRASVVVLFAGKMVPGDYVMQVMGTVVGIRFKGTDTIRVISPP